MFPFNLLDGASDETLGVVLPPLVYWSYSCFYEYLDNFHPKLVAPWRLHSRADETKMNRVTRGQGIIRTVLLQQLVQALITIALFVFDPTRPSPEEAAKAAAGRTLWSETVRVLIAFFVMDTWQYFWHRLMHESRFLYRHLHSWHHRLVVPYAYGALYNHPLEGFIMDTCGGVTCFLVSGYHDVHHQPFGLRLNYSQPFFSFWDVVLGTYQPFTLKPRKDGGLEAAPVPAPNKPVKAE